MTQSKLHAVILAAGKGTRMGSSLPKVLHQLAGRTLLHHVVHNVAAVSPDNIHVIYGYLGEQVKNSLPETSVNWVHQAEQLGSAHAVKQVLPEVSANDRLLILLGDVPLISPSTLKKLLKASENKVLTLLTVKLDQPKGYGRIIRDNTGKVLAIIEEKDANRAQKDIKEINTGIMVMQADAFERWWPKLTSENQQNEYYLTDCVAQAVSEGQTVVSVEPDNSMEVQGINNKIQLVTLERYYQYQQAERLMNAGVTIADPNRLDIRGEAKIAGDVFLDVNVVLEGQVKIGAGSHIGPNCVIRDSSIGKNCVVQPNCVIEDSHVGDQCSVGPFARLRPGTKMEKESRVGNFVEVKNSTIGNQSKVNHLSYIGDSSLGEAVNVGAGVITCNYDGANKHKTTIKDHAFIGSNSQLVAPVTIGSHATVGAGSTITKDVKANSLALERAEQKIISPWKRPTKKES